MGDPGQDGPLIVRYLVTEDGETGHPMDVCAVTVAIDTQGVPEGNDMARLADLIRRDITRKVVLRRTKTKTADHAADDTTSSRGTDE